jgi:hypothetical protein
VSPNFCKIPQCQISWNPVQWPSSCCMWTEWQTRWDNKYIPATFYSEHTITWHQASHIIVYMITWKHGVNLLHFTFSWIKYYNTVHSPLTSIPRFLHVAYTFPPKLVASCTSWNIGKICQTARIISQKTVISSHHCENLRPCASALGLIWSVVHPFMWNDLCNIGLVAFLSSPLQLKHQSGHAYYFMITMREGEGERRTACNLNIFLHLQTRIIFTKLCNKCLKIN